MIRSSFFISLASSCFHYLLEIMNVSPGMTNVVYLLVFVSYEILSYIIFVQKISSLGLNISSIICLKFFLYTSLGFSSGFNVGCCQCFLHSSQYYFFSCSICDFRLIFIYWGYMWLLQLFSSYRQLSYGCLLISYSISW